MKNSYYLSIFLIFLSGCHSVSNNILDSFKTVNASLTKSNEVIANQNTCDLAYFEIKQKGDKNKALERNADTLYGAYKRAIDLLEKIKETLTEQDSVGDKTNSSADLLVHTPLGDSLGKAVLEVPRDCYAALISPGKKSSLDNTLNDTKLIISHKDWIQENFSNAPTSGVITMLNYFKMELTAATAITLSDIDGSLK